LQFANGKGGRICSTEGARDWTDRFAGIMELKPCDSNDLPFYLFYRNDSRISETPTEFIKDTLGGKGLTEIKWQPRRIGPISIFSNNQTSDLVCEIGSDASFEDSIYSMWYSLYPFYRHILSFGGVPFHAGLVEWNGRGILFTAPGGTGKSTTISRLPPDWSMHCDDEVLIIRDIQNRYVAHPFPTWSNFFLNQQPKSWIVESSLPISAVFFLIQAETDDIKPIGSGTATVLINQAGRQILRRAWNLEISVEQLELRRKLFELSCELAKTVPCYMLNISLTGNFW